VVAQTAIGAAARTVLVADETAFVRDRFRSALTGAGHRVLLAGNRAELLACLESAGPTIDLLVLDVHLVASGATSLVGHIRRALTHSPPIIAFSGTVGSPDVVQELAALGVTTFLNEYTSEGNIVRALQSFLSGDAVHRRTSPRVAIGVAVSYRHGHSIGTAVTLNVGRGGVAIRSTNPLAVGTPVRVRLRLPAPCNELEADGRVVWSDPGTGMGLQFTRVAPDAQARLDAFVDSHFFSNRRG
jgi:uncharacterized protein (TIGR02266 family)